MKLHKEPHPGGALGAAAIAALLVSNAVSLPRPALAQVSENGRSLVSMSLRVAPADLTILREIPDSEAELWGRVASVIHDDVPEALDGFILMKQSVNDPDLVDEYRLTVIRQGGCSVETSRQLQDDITLALEAELKALEQGGGGRPAVNLAPRDCVEVFAAEQAKHGWDEHFFADAVLVLAAVATSGDLGTLAAAAAGVDNVHSAQITHKGTSVSLQLFMVGSCNADAVGAVLEQTKQEASRRGVDVSFGGRECLKALVQVRDLVAAAPPPPPPPIDD